MTAELRRWRWVLAAPFLVAASVMAGGYIAAMWAAKHLADVDPGWEL